MAEYDPRSSNARRDRTLEKLRKGLAWPTLTNANTTVEYATSTGGGRCGVGREADRMKRLRGGSSVEAFGNYSQAHSAAGDGDDSGRRSQKDDGDTKYSGLGDVEVVGSDGSAAGVLVRDNSTNGAGITESETAAHGKDGRGGDITGEQRWPVTPVGDECAGCDENDGLVSADVTSTDVQTGDNKNPKSDVHLMPAPSTAVGRLSGKRQSDGGRRDDLRDCTSQLREKSGGDRPKSETLPTSPWTRQRGSSAREVSHRTLFNGVGCCTSLLGRECTNEPQIDFANQCNELREWT